MSVFIHLKLTLLCFSTKLWLKSSRGEITFWMLGHHVFGNLKGQSSIHFSETN